MFHYTCDRVMSFLNTMKYETRFTLTLALPSWLTLLIEEACVFFAVEKNVSGCFEGKMEAQAFPILYIYDVLNS